ncbi:MAG: hypothetical protein ACKOPS_20530, partial [Cyanobium sp.]
APSAPQPPAPELASLLPPCSPCCWAPRGGPVFVSPPDQFSLSPDSYPQWWMLLVAILAILSNQGSLLGMERRAD